MTVDGLAARARVLSGPLADSLACLPLAGGGDWLFEPDANLGQEEALTEQAIERGRHAVELFTEENQGGVGCVQCHGPTLEGGRILNTETPDDPIDVRTAPNLRTVCGGPDAGHPAIFSLEDVRAVIDELPLHLLRGHVGRRAEQAAIPGEIGGDRELGHPEIENLDHLLLELAVEGDEDVVRLHVPVNDAEPVRGIERAADGATDLDR